MNPPEFEILLRRVIDRWNAQLATSAGALQKVDLREMKPQNAWFRWAVDTHTQFEGEELEHNELQAVVMWGSPDDVRVLPGDRFFALLLEKGLREALDREHEFERDPLKKAMRELDRLLMKDSDGGFRRLPDTRQEKLLVIAAYNLQPSRQKERWIRKQFGGTKENPNLSPSTLRSWKRLL